MTDHDDPPTAPRAAPEPPPLPARLLDPRPVIAVVGAGFLAATVAAFTASPLHGWRPAALAGLALTVPGAAIFGWQRRAARLGRRGAQTGLD